MYGRKFMGNVRTTYLIDRDGKIARRWDNVKVDGHAEEVHGGREGAVTPLERLGWNDFFAEQVGAEPFRSKKRPRKVAGEPTSE